MGEQVNLAQILQQLTQALNAINGGNAEKQHSELFATINTQISEFSYDPETDRTFAAWFERYGPYIERDGQNLPDEMKVRLLIGKLGSQEYVRYTEGILPQKPTQISFKDTVTNLGKLFCGTKSLFVRRFEAFQLTKADHQSPIEFADQVNASCETAKMELSKEEVKGLIFVSGIGDSDRDLRERCLRLMEEAHLKGTQIRFAALVEECRIVLSLRSSAAALSRPMGPNTNSISVKPQRITERSRRPLPRVQSRSPTRSNSTQSRTHQGTAHPLPGKARTTTNPANAFTGAPPITNSGRTTPTTGNPEKGALRGQSASQTRTGGTSGGPTFDRSTEAGATDELVIKRLSDRTFPKF